MFISRLWTFIMKIGILACMSSQLPVAVLIFSSIPPVVQAQSHRSYRTCSMNPNDPIDLYYDSSKGMYQTFNSSSSSDEDNFDYDRNDTDTVVDVSSNDTVTRRQRRRLRTGQRRLSNDTVTERIRNHNHIILRHQQSRNHRHDNDGLVENYTIAGRQPQQPWYNYYFYRSYRFIIHQFLDMSNEQGGDSSQPQPAIAMMTDLRGDDESMQQMSKLKQQQQHRDLQWTSPNSNSRGDGDKVNNIDPNIQLYEPNDTKAISVRLCQCSDQNSNYTYYCPLNKAYCYVPIRFAHKDVSIYETYPYYDHPVCIPTPTATSYIARNFKLIGCGALAVISILLLVSPHGHHAVRYCCCCFCSSTLPRCSRRTSTTSNSNNNKYYHRYIDYIIEKQPKMTKSFFERYMNDANRQERFNQRYIELQRLHGEVTDNDDDNNDPTTIHIVTTTSKSNNNNTSRTTNTNTSEPLLLSEFEESIVRDIYYYRPSLLLKTRIFNGSSEQQRQQQQQDIQVLTTTTTRTDRSPTSPLTATVADVDDHLKKRNSSPYDADDDWAVSKDTDTTDGSYCIAGMDSKRDDDGSCMICFNSIDIGCTVGVLPNCQHVFHTACLKDWLKRRNVCPLCLDSDVAVVAFSRKASNDDDDIIMETTLASPPATADSFHGV